MSCALSVSKDLTREERSYFVCDKRESMKNHIFRTLLCIVTNIESRLSLSFPKICCEDCNYVCVLIK